MTTAWALGALDTCRHEPLKNLAYEWSNTQKSTSYCKMEISSCISKQFLTHCPTLALGLLYTNFKWKIWDSPSLPLIDNQFFLAFSLFCAIFNALLQRKMVTQLSTC